MSHPSSVAMSAGSRLCLHHVGGRSGSTSFPVLPSFERDFIRILYDADADCLPQALQRNRASEAELHVLPYCLAAASGTSDLCITYDPNNSSLRASNPRYHGYYSAASQDCDTVFGEATEVVERRSVQTVALDQLVGSGSVAPPDFLSIDTEGTEFEILQGALRALRSSVLGLVVEVEFHQLHEGQRLFGDVQETLVQHGFDFVRFLHIGELSPYRAPIGCRGDGFQTHADALFLRRLDAFDDLDGGRARQMRKLAFFAVVFQQFEFGIQCLRAAREVVASGGSVEAPRPAYERFLDALEEAVGAAPATLPPTFSARFSAAESRARFDVDSPGTRTDSSLKAAVRRVPWLFDPLRRGRRAAGRAGQRVRSGAAALAAMLPGRGHSPVERVLMDYGLRSQAEALRARRSRR